MILTCLANRLDAEAVALEARASQAQTRAAEVEDIPTAHNARLATALEHEKTAVRLKSEAEAIKAGAEALQILAELRLHHRGGARVGGAVFTRSLCPEVVDRAVALVGHVEVEPIDWDARLAAHRVGIAQAVADGDFERT